MPKSIPDILTILQTHAPGLTLVALESCIDRKLVSLIEQKIEAIILAQIDFLTLADLIALHQELTSQAEPPKPVGFVPDAIPSPPDIPKQASPPKKVVRRAKPKRK